MKTIAIIRACICITKQITKNKKEKMLSHNDEVM